MSDASLALSSPTVVPTTIAFVDAGVADSGSLVSQFQPGTEVHLLDSVNSGNYDHSRSGNYDR
ncbi:MAG: hypothetical protein ACKO7W_18115 [Elainella sp.]